MHSQQKKHDKHPLLYVQSLDTQAATVESGNVTSTTTQLICPRTSFGRIVGMSAEAFVLPNNIRRWAGRRDRACFYDGTDAGEECARPVKHKEEDCTDVTEVTVKLPVVDTNTIEILSLVHILQIYSMSAMFQVKIVRDAYYLNDN